MRIRDEGNDLSEPKTLKVSLPARLHLKLHSLKILTGTTISDTVEEAVERYFDEDLDADFGEAAFGEPEATEA